MLLVILLLGALTAAAGWELGVGRYTTTPALTGLTRAQAETKAQAKGFHVSYRAPAYSEVVPAGSVISQRPAATDRIRKGATITLVLSRGKERHSIPDLRGKSQAQAESALRALRLTPQISPRYDDKVAADTVISQSPPAGRLVRPATVVTLFVSKGPAPVSVPSVVGDNVDDAKRTLADLGLGTDVTRVYSETVAKDEVVSQSPASGQLTRGSKVKLTVSNGPPLVTVPNVKGMKVHDAQQILEAAGFRVRVVPFLFGNTVLTQNPGGGSTAPKGSTVDILR